MLRVGIWLKEDYSPLIGGGFSYYDTLIRHIDDYNFNSNLEIIFISTKPIEGLQKKKLNIGRIGFFSNILYKLVKRMPYSRLRYKLVEASFKSKKKRLSKEGIDILYYPIQAQQTIPNYPFIATNWDLAHLTTYPFPEIIKGDDFSRREAWYKQQLLQALVVFVESQEGKKELLNFVKLPENRVKVVPLFAGNYTKIDNLSQQEILNKFSLKKEQYFFYPAQFWAHKNHYNLIVAFKKVLEKFPNLKLVFSGSDKGNLQYIFNLVNSLRLSEKISFLGFVKSEELYTLYSNALALVMPSLLGPTNMPLLEARELNCPVLCSYHKGHVEMLQDGALYFDALNIKDMAFQMIRITNLKERATLLERANTKTENRRR